MGIKELAKQYAEGKALNAITTAIEEAYAKGYKDGYTQGVSDAKKNIPNELESGIEFVDLGLPSGTLWATDYLRDENGKIKYLIFDEASQYNLPTVAQRDELFKFTKWYIDNNSPNCKIHFLGRNGAFLDIFPDRFLYEVYPTYWLKNESDDTQGFRSIGAKLEKYFKGEKLPMIVVKQP